jgi:integrase
MSDYEALLFKTAFLLAFFGLMRVSETAFLCNEIQSNDSFVQIHIKSSKTDQMGKGQTIRVNFESEDAVLLKRTLENYKRQRPAVQGQYLCHANGKPLTQYQFKHVLRKCLEYLGQPLNIFKSQSFRMGGATYMFNKGMSESAIKQAGRWKSNVYQSYIRV